MSTSSSNRKFDLKAEVHEERRDGADQGSNHDGHGGTVNPLDDGSLQGYRVIRVPMTSLTKEVCAPLGVKPRDAERSKNFFALGLVSWMYTRPTEHDGRLDREVASPTTSWCWPPTRAAFIAGYNFGETTEAVGHRFEVRPAMLPAGEYTSITGNTALAWGIVAAGQLAKLPVTLGSLPDHAGVGHPPRAVQAQALRRAHRAGRGRDRGGRAWPSARRSPATSA